MRFAVAGAIALAATLNARAEQANVVADRDATIYNEDADASNGGGEYFIVGNNPAGDQRRALLHFDLADIPSGSTVNSTFLEVQLSITRPGDVPIDLHRVTAHWEEGTTLPVGGSGGEGAGGGPAQPNDVTWGSNLFGTSTWTTPGGDYQATPTATTIVGELNPPGIFTWSSSQLTSDVQDWIDNPASNFGFILITPPTGLTGKRFFSRENPFGVPPELVIDFTAPDTCICESGGDPDTINIQDLTGFLGLYFENVGQTVVPGTNGDVDNNATVNITDILVFLQCWFPASTGADC